MAGLTDQVDESTANEQKSSSSSSSNNSSSSSDDKWPYYKEETPFMAVIDTGDNVIVRNEPQELSITYRQYSAGADMKKWDEPDSLIKYWETDWLFKRDRHIYEQQYPESEFTAELREDPVQALEDLREAKSVTDSSGVQNTKASCRVCSTEFDRKHEYERVQGIRVCPSHTVKELVENNVVGSNRSKNRRWE
jgi:hypothetical protein